VLGETRRYVQRYDGTPGRPDQQHARRAADADAGSRKTLTLIHSRLYDSRIFGREIDISGREGNRLYAALNSVLF